MRSDLRPDDFLPVRSDAMSECNAIQTQIPEHLADEIANRLEAPFAAPCWTTAPAAPTEHQSGSEVLRWSLKTIPVGIFGKKNVDFWGITSPSSVARKTSSGVIELR